MNKFYCDCGKRKPPTKRLCAKCETRKLNYVRHKTTSGVHKAENQCSAIDWETYWVDTTPIVGASLAILEKALAAITPRAF